MSDFDRTLSVVLGVEGELADRGPEADPGGLTNYGVTQGTYDAWRARKGLPEASVRDISGSEVRSIYEEVYWRPSGGPLLPWPINLLVFDYAVNSGVSRAVRALQLALRVPNDGIVGPKTAAAAAERVRDKEWLGLFLADRVLYMSILSNWPQNKRGWLKRLNWLAFEIGKAL